MASAVVEIDTNSASFYALHVALQTLKERCQNLQHRLTVVEDENEVLRKTAGLDRPDSVPGENNEDYLRGMVGDLVRQKSQLTEHIEMVTKENSSLWRRLSKLTKENSSLGMSITKIRDAINMPSQAAAVAGKSNNLIRSKTFTRPNPKLRDRTVTEEEEHHDDEEGNMSLEEISLQIINKLVEGKENFEQKCEEILETNATENLCFGFKGTRSAAAAGNQMDTCEVADTIEKCTSEATLVKDSLLQQQSQLKRLIMSLKENKKPICDDCSKRHHGGGGGGETTKVQSVDSQTKDESRVEAEDRSSNRGIFVTMERTCPMCGKIFATEEDFEIFQRHVEYHFIDDDNELDLSIEKNYDMISHTAQNF